MVHDPETVGGNEQDGRLEGPRYVRDVLRPGDGREQPTCALDEDDVREGAGRANLPDEPVDVDRDPLPIGRNRGREGGREANERPLRLRLIRGGGQQDAILLSLTVASALDGLDGDHTLAGSDERPRERDRHERLADTRVGPNNDYDIQVWSFWSAHLLVILRWRVKKR